MSLAFLGLLSGRRSAAEPPLQPDASPASPFEKDRELVDACLRGDSAAWEKLLSRYERLIFAIPRRAGLDTDEAADVYQDVALALYRGLPRLKDTRGLTNWVLRTTQRITRDRRLKSARMPRLQAGPDSDSPPEAVDPAPLKFEELEELGLQHEIRAALARLEPRCQRLLLLLFYTDPQPSYVEIARELGVTAGSIGPTRARCFEKLKRHLGKPSK